MRDKRTPTDVCGEANLEGVKDQGGNCKEVISFTSPPLMAARLTKFSRGLNRHLRGK